MLSNFSYVMYSKLMVFRKTLKSRIPQINSVSITHKRVTVAPCSQGYRCPREATVKSPAHIRAACIPLMHL